MIKNIKIAICDDEQNIATELSGYLKEYPNTELYIFTSAEEIINNNNSFDIAFLDIEIGDVSGFDLALHIYNTNKDCIISFVTSHSEYAVKGYRYNIFRYILKAEPEQMKRILIAEVMQEYTRRNKQLKVQNKGNLRYVPIRDILYIESFKSTVTIHTLSENIRWNKPINEAEEELIDCLFVRCHKSFLVNVEYIKSVIDNRLISMIDNTEIPVGRKYCKGVKWAVSTRMEMK